MKNNVLGIAIAGVLAVSVSGCVSNGYKNFYKSYGDIPPQLEAEFLANGAEPDIWQVNYSDIDSAVRVLRAKNYVPIGYSSFNGPYQDIANAKEEGKRLRAVAIIVGSSYTSTQTSTMPFIMPTTQTTYGSGTVSSGGIYGSYSGSSTTYGSAVVPIVSQQNHYNQGAVYFAKSNRKFRIGLEFFDIRPDQQKALGRNTGAVVEVVFEKTPAFYANVLIEDLIIAVDGVPVRNAEEVSLAFSKVPVSTKSLILTVIRNGQEKTIELNLL